MSNLAYDVNTTNEFRYTDKDKRRWHIFEDKGITIVHCEGRYHHSDRVMTVEDKGQEIIDSTSF